MRAAIAPSGAARPALPGCRPASWWPRRRRLGSSSSSSSSSSCCRAGASARQPDGGGSASQPPSRPDPSLLNSEIISIALPMLATLAADPIAGLVDTAYVGRIGAAQLAGVGVALSIFNTTTKLFNMPLLSVTTSSGARAQGAAQQGDTAPLSAAASSSIIIAGGLGMAQAAMLLACSAWLTSAWGAAPGGTMSAAALDFLRWRALGAPVTVLLLALQGVYRGLQDTRTPLAATLAANAFNVALGPLLIFVAGLGVKGAAMATVASQALPCAWLLRKLTAQVPLSFTNTGTLAEVLQLFAPTGFLILRTASITAAYAVATSALARAGPAAAACHQICFQLWLASSLLADSLAVACQTLLASSLAAGQLDYARQVVRRTTAMAGALGGLLMLGLAASRESLPQLFTNNPEVLALVGWVLPLVIVTQPINAMAFVWDGALYGVGGFKFASVAMAAAALPAMGVMLGGERLLRAVAGPAVGGALAQAQLTCVWAGLGLLMALRALSIWLPYRLRLPPFRKLYAEHAAPAGGTA